MGDNPHNSMLSAKGLALALLILLLPLGARAATEAQRQSELVVQRKREEMRTAEQAPAATPLPNASKPKPASGGSASASTITNSVGMTLVYIKPGTFTMGSPGSEKDRGSSEVQHQVTLTQGFYMGATEVTQGQWESVMGSNPSGFTSCGKDCPVEQVSSYDAAEFCNRLSDKERKIKCYSGRGTNWSRAGSCTGYRLPTEAEWEYAARAGTSTAWSCGDEASCLERVAWYGANSGDTTHRVGGKQANGWGLYDMHGNVWELCWDWYSDYSGTDTDPVGPYSGKFRIVRGGSFYFYGSSPRSAKRFVIYPDYRINKVGFRVVSPN